MAATPKPRKKRGWQPPIDETTEQRRDREFRERCLEVEMGIDPRRKGAGGLPDGRIRPLISDED